ncbi:class I SAM-dependent methyltransferase [Nakamurella lactea]|uniref:class I SAM-dependent methyltransferase n=1 Tax=Nakamurella lactea TaxID=459515 RepID=UPI000423D3D3|nr:class I SAM-dependent methyltransferase [Nakamurella lactea]
MAERRREKQLAYSEIQAEMSRVETRTQKAQKIHAVLDHVLGSDWVHRATMLDVGSSVGFNVEAAAKRGVTSIGVDIDVPGLARARAERDPRCIFVCGDGEALPFADDSIDVVVFNHIYEHVVDPDAVIAEIYRVLSPTGVVYLGLGNKLGVMEPHHRLPFLSWLPQGLADRYMKVGRKGDHYYESYRTIGGLKKMLRKFYVTDYSFSIIAHPEEFAAGDQVGGRAASLVRKTPAPVRSAGRQLLPTVIWLASKSELRPAGPALAIAPETVVRPF